MTDLASFDSLRGYVGFTDASAAALRALHPLACPRFPEIVDDFYQAIAAHPDARAAITGGAAQIARLKTTLTAWLDSLLLGPHDEAYLETRARIGRVHVRIGLPQAHMLTAMNRIRVRLGEIVQRSLRDRPAELARTEDALNQILDLELAIMLETYRQELTSRSEQAERLAAMGEFASSIGHELRGPLGVIESSLYLLRQHLPPAAGAAPPVAKHLDRIAEQLRRSRRTIDDLLELARNRPLQVQRAPVRAVVEAALESAALPATVTVDVSVPPELSADFDWDQIQHALVALFNNASQAMNGAGDLTVQAAVDEKGLSLRVCDDGPGVPVELHGRIFDALFTTKAKGSGLGLALCRRILDAHRGRIEVEPSDHGARFALWNPEGRTAGGTWRKGCPMTAGPVLFVAFTLAAADMRPSAGAPPRVSYLIDVPRSRFVVNTETTGMSSMFGHDHKIEVGNYTGEVSLVPGEPATASLALSVYADSLHAVEEMHEDISWEIDAVLRDHVLETRKYPMITFKSRAVKTTRREDGTFDVSLAGELDLHGVRRAVMVPLKLAFQGETLRATGTLGLRQRDFKIAPFSFAGGAATVSDRVTLSFTIVATRATGAPSRH